MVTRRAALARTATLVAYKGEQPKGFTIDTVPDGWFVQADDTIGPVPAPEKAPAPSAGPSPDELDNATSCVGKIAIMLQSKDQSAVPDGRKVRVGDRDGVHVHKGAQQGVG